MTELALPKSWMWSPFKRGPGQQDGVIVVSVTELTATHLHDVPAITLDGLRLRGGWQGHPGAIGLSLYSYPFRGISGSVSFWESEDDLRSFVSHPNHVPIMHKWGGRTRMRTTSWTQTGRSSPADALAKARRRWAVTES
jgi:hypothetical protein